MESNVNDRALGAAETPGRLSFLSKALAPIAGVDARRLESCGSDDRIMVARVAFAMLLAFTMAAGAYTYALSLAFSPQSDAAWTAIVAAGAMLAGTVLLVDHAIVHRHWFDAGLVDARRRGFETDGKTTGMISGLLQVTFRLTFSLVIAFTIATFITLGLFAKDVERRMGDDARAANASIVAEAERRVDADISVLAARRAEAERAVAEARRRRDAVAEAADRRAEALRAEQTRRVTELQRQHDALATEADQRRGDATFEESGVRANDRVSGVAGRGGRFGAFQARAAQAEAEARRLAAELAAAKAAQAAPIPAPEVEAASAALALAEARLTQTVSAESGARGSRDAEIARAAEADPAFVRVQDGLITRLEALAALTASPVAASTVLLVKLLLMLVEMAGVVVKMLHGSGSRYAVKSAIAFEVDVARLNLAGEALLADAGAEIATARERRDAVRERRDRARAEGQARARGRRRFDTLVAEAMHRPGL